MKGFSDEQVILNMRHHYECARDSSKEGVGTGRGVGSAGRAADEWIMWRTEALRRGLIQ